MTVSSYLFRKYSIYSKDIISKPFTSNHVALELLCSDYQALMTIKEILGVGYKKLSYLQFERVVCTAIDLE